MAQLTRNCPGMAVTAVIFATDLSDRSRKTGEYAALFAGYFAAKLVVAHAFVPSQAAMEAEAEGTPVSRQRKEVADLLAERAAALTAPGTAVSALADGVPERTIPRLADQYAPSLIALGTHGGNRLGRLAIGSTAEKILRTASWPCLTIGPRVPPLSGSSGSQFRRILYATDLTPSAAHAAAFAVFFAERLRAKIDVLHVIHGDGDGQAAGRDQELRQQFYEALDGVVPRYAREFCEAKTFVEFGGAHQRILEHIEEYGIGLLVLGIKKTSHLGLEMRTSGAFQLLAGAPCPVLTITG